MRLSAALLALPALAAAQEQYAIQTIFDIGELQTPAAAFLVDEMPQQRSGCLHSQFASLSAAVDDMVTSLFATPIFFMEEARPSAHPCESEMRATGCDDAFCLKQHPDSLGDACVLLLLSDMLDEQEGAFGMQVSAEPVFVLEPVEFELTFSQAEPRDQPMLLGADGHGQLGFMRAAADENSADADAAFGELLHAIHDVMGEDGGMPPMMMMERDGPPHMMHMHAEPSHHHQAHGAQERPLQQHVRVSREHDFAEPLWTSAATPTEAHAAHSSFVGMLLIFVAACCLVRACIGTRAVGPSEPPTVVILEPLQSGAVPPVYSQHAPAEPKPVSDIKML